MRFVLSLLSALSAGLVAGMALTYCAPHRSLPEPMIVEVSACRVDAGEARFP